MAIKTDANIPTFSTLDPAHKLFVEVLKKRTTGALAKVPGGANSHTPAELQEVLAGALVDADSKTNYLSLLREFEAAQGNKRIVSIRDAPLLVAQGKRLDALENTLFHEMLTLLPYVQAGISRAFNLPTEYQLRFQYELVAGSMSTDGISFALRNEHTGPEKLRQQLHEQMIYSKGSFNLETLIGKFESIVKRDTELSKDREMNTPKGPKQGNDVVLESTRHNFNVAYLTSVIDEAHQQWRSSSGKYGIPSRQKIDNIVEVHGRLKRDGAQYCHSYARKVAEYLAGERINILDMFAERVVADTALMPHIMGPYLQSMNADPSFWVGHIKAHHYPKLKDAQNEFRGSLKRSDPLFTFVSAIADLIEPDEKKNEPRPLITYQPRHLEFLIPIPGELSGKISFEMVSSMQYISPSQFYAAEFRKDIRHDFYKARQITELFKEASPSVLATYAFLCGLVEGFPGLLDASHKPIAEQVYAAGCNRLRQTTRKS